MSIRDVAHKAGVGIGTVSRVINEHPSVSNKIRDRVQKAMKELDYTPNVHAQRMWKGRTNAVCFILSNRRILQSLHAHIFRGVEEFCAVNNYSVLFTTFNYGPHTAASDLELPAILRARGLVDGVILGGVNYPNLIDRIKSEEIPYTVFSNNIVTEAAVAPAHNGVLFDDRHGAEQAVEYLVQLGHRHIWFIGDTAWPWNRRRFESYTAVMKRKEYEEQFITQGLARFGHEHGSRAVRRILESDKECTAIFAATDYIAAGVISAAQELGRHVPEDLSVIGFDELDEFRYYRPKITSIGTDKEKIGEYCSLLLIRQIEDGKGFSKQANVRIPMHLSEGESCAPPQTSQRSVEPMSQRMHEGERR